MEGWGGKRGGKVDNKCDLVGNSDLNNRTELQSAIQISGFMLWLREGPAITAQTVLKLVTLLPQPPEHIYIYISTTVRY